MIGVDLDGKAAPGAKIEVKAVRLDWEYKKGKYKHEGGRSADVRGGRGRRIAVPCAFADEEGRHVPGHRDDRRRARAGRTRPS